MKESQLTPVLFSAVYFILGDMPQAKLAQAERFRLILIRCPYQRETVKEVERWSDFYLECLGGKSDKEQDLLIKERDEWGKCVTRKQIMTYWNNYFHEHKPQGYKSLEEVLSR